MSSVRNLQSRLLPKLHGQHGLIKEDAIKEQNCVAADIYYQFAKVCLRYLFYNYVFYFYRLLNM